jgi:putative hydrolase of the HAD superfamily
MRAVIFDLWDTLVLWDVNAAPGTYERMAEHAGVEVERFQTAWMDTHLERAVGPLRENVRTVLELVGGDVATVDALCEIRREDTRRALVPRDGALETLEELRRRGVKRGLISVCSGDVEEVWKQTPLAGRLDDVVLSCAVGLRKPDPRIYELAARNLGVEPEECLFVGDGANDELAGAERAGMRAVLILRPEQDEPYWEEARGWQPRITAIPDVLRLL